MRTQSEEDGPARGLVLRQVAGLSVGTIFAKIVAASAQFVLALWLGPADFGLWAAASSALLILTSFTSFGEIQAYAAGRNRELRIVRSRVFRLNGLLAAIGLLISLAYFLAGNWQVGLLVVIAAATIPFAGDSDLGFTSLVRVRDTRNALVGQILGSLVKLVAGIAIAWATGSALALAVSVLAMHWASEAWFWRSRSRSNVPDSQAKSEPHGSNARSRWSWAVNAACMGLPMQIGFLGGQFVASPAELGTYFFAFQIALTVSALIAVPLSRVSLSELGRLGHGDARHLAVRTIEILTSGTRVVALLGVLLMWVGSTYVPSQWQGAIVPIVLLLASLPARITTPVLDAYQQSRDRWWINSATNVVYAAGILGFSLFLSVASVQQVALMVSIWMTLFTVARSLVTLGFVQRVTVAAVLNLIVAGGIVAAALTASDQTALGITSVLLATCAAEFGLQFRRRRRVA